MGRIAHIVRTERENAINPLILDAGDIFQGSMLYTKYHGEVEVELLNKIGYDASTIGNHEFDDGAANLAKQLSKAKYDVVCANLDCSRVPALAAINKPSVVKEIDGEKVGIIGAVTPDLESLANKLEGVKLKAKGDQWIEPIKEEVEKLSAQGIDKIILVTHCGLPMEELLAERLPKVDAIVGGHSHTRLSKPVIIKHADETTTTIVQTGCYGRAVGKLVLSFDGNGVVDTKSTNYKLVDANSNIEQDKDIVAYVDKMAESLSPDRHKTIATSTSTFGGKHSQTDSAIGDLICDSLVALKEAKRYGVSIALHNRGGIRGELEEGPVTLADIQQILPFENYVVFATVKGSTIKRALERSVSDGLGGKFLDVAGLKFAYDRTQPEGQRIIFLRVRDAQGKWAPLAPDKKYKMAMNHYNFEGGEGYDFSDGEKVEKTNLRMSDAMNRYLSTKKILKPAKPGRMVEVRNGALAVIDRDDTGKSVKLSGAAPAARITMVAGTAPGVSTIYSAFPVPMEDARILKTKLRADENGNLILGVEQVLKLFDKRDFVDGRVWLCLVAYPRKGAKGERTIITGPVSIDGTTTTGSETDCSKTPSIN